MAEIVKTDKTRETDIEKLIEDLRVCGLKADSEEFSIRSIKEYMLIRNYRIKKINTLSSKYAVDSKN